jgi:hypothetical protein
MSTPPESNELSHKIARLVQERGWNQEDFANIARLNRHTVRQILAQDGSRRLRNSTVSACARALGVSVNDLRTQPLDKLLPRMSQAAAPIAPDDPFRRLRDRAVQQELLAWIERNPDRSRRLSREDVDELLALQGPDGPLVVFGVDGFVRRMERRRALLQRVHHIAGTEYVDLLEQLVGLIYDRVRPEGETASGER